MGFKTIEEGAEEYYMPIKGVRQAENTDSVFVKALWKKLSSTPNSEVDKKELDIAFRTPQIQECLTKVVCKHKIEWAYTPEEIQKEAGDYKDYLISLQDDTLKEELERLKEEKLGALKLKIEKQNFWSALKKASYTPKPTEKDQEYETKKQKIKERYNWGTELTESNQKLVDSKLDELDKEYQKGKYAPKTVPRKLPKSDVLWHFHPIGFLEQLERISNSLSKNN